MKPIKIPLCFFLLLLAYQCASPYQLQKTAPIGIEKAYYQNWVAGTENGGSGTNLFVDIKKGSIILDSIYFRGQKTKLKLNPSKKTQYIGYFVSNSVHAKQNTTSSFSIPFNLSHNECVIRYYKGDTVQYYKIRDLIKLEPLYYPSATTNRQ